MKRKLILLHGALGTSQQMLPVARRLNDYFDVHNILFNGHGVGNAGEVFDMLSLAKQIHETGRAGERSIVFGYSMGGYAAITAAAFQPDLFDGIITLGTKFDWSVETLGKELQQLVPEKIREKVPLLASLLEERHGSSWPALVEETANMMRKLSAQHEEIESKWPELKVPVLMLLGEQDKMVSVQESLLISEMLPAAKFTILAETPHQIERINIDLLCSEVISFTITL
jgi:pimeloyl-ACP methyl ester carboxylesterase